MVGGNDQFQSFRYQLPLFSPSSESFCISTGWNLFCVMAVNVEDFFYLKLVIMGSIHVPLLVAHN